MVTDRIPLSEIFSPRGIAVVGVSPNGKDSFMNGIVTSLMKAGFPAIYPVNPKYPEIFGLKCYSKLTDIPGDVDHVAVGIPAEAALSLLDDCTAKGVKVVQFFTAGFSESGDSEREALEQEMLNRARKGGFRIIGPNCVGLFVPKYRVVNEVDVPFEPGPIAFISQSGGNGLDMPYYGGARGLRFSKVVSYGNALDVDESELLEYLAEDTDTDIISAYIEGVKDGRRFISALKGAASRKPLVIYKGGRSEAGKRATYGHTASITSSVDIFDALCRQNNVIQAEDMDDLVDKLVALRFMKPLPKGMGVAVIGSGGGPTVLASDEMERAGLKLPHLSIETQEELRQFLPMVGSIMGNPIDATNLTSPKAISATIRTLSKLPEIDMFIYHLGFHYISRWGRKEGDTGKFIKPIIKALSEVQRDTGKPVIVTLRPAADWNGMREFLSAQDMFIESGLPVFNSMRQAAKTMASVVAWKRKFDKNSIA